VCGRHFSSFGLAYLRAQEVTRPPPLEGCIMTNGVAPFPRESKVYPKGSLEAPTPKSWTFRFPPLPFVKGGCEVREAASVLVPNQEKLKKEEASSAATGTLRSPLSSFPQWMRRRQGGPPLSPSSSTSSSTTNTSTTCTLAHHSRRRRRQRR